MGRKAKNRTGSTYQKTEEEYIERIELKELLEEILKSRRKRTLLRLYLVIEKVAKDGKISGVLSESAKIAMAKKLEILLTTRSLSQADRTASDLLDRAGYKPTDKVRVDGSIKHSTATELINTIREIYGLDPLPVSEKGDSESGQGPDMAEE